MFSSARSVLLCASRQIVRGCLSGKTDCELVQMLDEKKLKFHEIEKVLHPDFERAVRVRREFVVKYIVEHGPGEQKAKTIDNVPYAGYQYENVVGSNCENIIGYIPIPVGLAGPILLDGKEQPIPMATTEGALVASTHRGARCILRAGGCVSRVVDDGMTRAPVVALPSMPRAVDLKVWVDGNFESLREWFDSTTRFGRLRSVFVRVVGRKAYLRFRATTGDAMGMNMISKGTEEVMRRLKEAFPDMEVLSLSGNMCTDKKPSAVNWVQGRGKGIVTEAVVPEDLVRDVLKTTVDDLVQLNIDKNLVGSALAGSIGGFNAQVANVVAAVFLATGQDPAQVVESSTALTYMEKTKEGSLRISVTMPCVEVGTIGGGTTLPAQRGILEMMGCAGPHPDIPGENARKLARIVCAAALCAELSLMAGLAAGHLVRAHMELNRK
ncbi:3-hydroxy-3-methylglutaryl-coenzyme A reductase 2 [Diplonema papillatum]|nr:3-hydroxy-3-methylglutaryl-coenzyme A reductase 2 [Diplonema papillatum]